MRFNVKINGGPEKYLTVKTGIYRDAVAAIPALWEVELPCDVEIWCERLVDQYGPYHYHISKDEYLNLVVRHIVLVK